MDADITLWILEFLARQPISQLLLNKILTDTHLSISAINNPRFKKTINLRHIHDEIAAGSASSESILESLETIEELDRTAQIKISDSMKQAYLGVAVECTVKHSSDGGQFFEAVKRIWRERIDKLELVKRSELVTDELREFKEEIEAALWDFNTCKRLLKRVRGIETLRLVRDYLKEAMETMGPSFLILAAKSEREMNENAADGPARRERAGGIKDSKKVDMNIPSSKFDTIPTPEVTKMKESLHSSTMELKALVKDPLPDALRLSDTLVSEMERKHLNETSVENRNGKDIDAPNPTVGAVVSQQSLVPKPSLLERNSTARTFEWDDSIDGLPEKAADNMEKYALDSSRKRAVSPLNIYRATKFARRRKMKRWSLEEEDALREGVEKFGRGNWKLILNSKRDIFTERTEVDLKDKWRNMMKY